MREDGRHLTGFLAVGDVLQHPLDPRVGLA
jgi:hypothetical protein